MFKRINNWHLSFLVVIVSIFSIALIQQYASAQWSDPSGFPGESGNFNLVVTPMVEDLQLANSDVLGANVKLYSLGDGPGDGSNIAALEISGNKQICLNGDCILSWAEGTNAIDGSGTIHYIPKFTGANTLGSSSVMYEGIDSTKQKIFIGTSSKGGALKITNQGGGYDVLEVLANSGTTNNALLVNNYGTNNSFLVNDISGDATPFVIDEAGRVGIGVTNPNDASEGLLHIKTASGNAELDIQSGSGTHWGIYQNGIDGPLSFWNTNNRVAFTNDGIDLVSGASNPYPEFIWKNDGYTKSSAKIATVINDTGTWARRGLAFFTNNSYDISTDSVERMRITETGDVGIGTTSPTKKLEVNGDVLIQGDLDVLGTATGNGGVLWSGGNDGHNSGLDADTVDGKHDGELDAAYITGYETKIVDDGWGNDNPKICTKSGQCSYSTAQCSPRTVAYYKSACNSVADCVSVCALKNPANFTCNYNCNGATASCSTALTDHVVGSLTCTTVTATDCLTPPEAEFPGSCGCTFNAPSVSYDKASVTAAWFCSEMTYDASVL